MGDVNYPKAYILYLVEFHGTRDYFECHELLEEYWKEHPGDAYADTWVGLIQIAVGSYHHRRGNLRGAAKMLRQSLDRLVPQHLAGLGLDGHELIRMVRERLAGLEVEEPFRDINLPITDEALRLECEEICSSRNLVWGAESPEDQELLHRHTLRDRSDVIAARAAAAAAKKTRRRQTD
ncbi:DUF309 domain-containing protein [Paenibacillus sepulcri]